VRKAVIAGWIVELAGIILWTYGWAAHAPWWIADFLPNRESEIGMVLVLVGMVPIYWPRGS